MVGWAKWLAWALWDEGPSGETYSVSGTIRDDGGQTFTVSAKLYQGASLKATAECDPDGLYVFPGVAPGAYRIVPSNEAYTFDPEYLDVTVSDADLAEKNFVGTKITYEVSGQILDSAGAGLDGVTVTIPAIAPVVTAGGGLYSFDLVPGDYTLTPTKSGSTFLPTSRDVEVVDDDVDVGDMQQVWGISGVIEDSDEDGFEGVTVTLSGDASNSTTTAGDGSYSFSGLVDGSYTVTPAKPGSVFSADHEDVSVSGDDVVVDTMNQVWRIYGVVVDGADDPVENVLMTMSGDLDDTTTTNASGEWEFYIINREVTITPSLAGYSFAPADQDFDVQGADEEAVDFVGTVYLTLPYTYDVSTEVSETSGGIAAQLASWTVSSGLSDGYISTSNLADVNSYTPAGVTKRFGIDWDANQDSIMFDLPFSIDYSLTALKYAVLFYCSEANRAINASILNRTASEINAGTPAITGFIDAFPNPLASPDQATIVARYESETNYTDINAASVGSNMDSRRWHWLRVLEDFSAGKVYMGMYRAEDNAFVWSTGLVNMNAVGVTLGHVQTGMKTFRLYLALGSTTCRVARFWIGGPTDDWPT